MSGVIAINMAKAQWNCSFEHFDNKQNDQSFVMFQPYMAHNCRIFVRKIMQTHGDSLVPPFSP